MAAYYSGQTGERDLKSSMALLLELDILCMQCEENYQLDSRKLILDKKTIIIMGSANNDLFRKKVQENSSRSTKR